MASRRSNASAQSPVRLSTTRACAVGHVTGQRKELGTGGTHTQIAGQERGLHFVFFISLLFFCLVVKEPESVQGFRPSPRGFEVTKDGSIFAHVLKHHKCPLPVSQFSQPAQRTRRSVTRERDR